MKKGFKKRIVSLLVTAMIVFQPCANSLTVFAQDAEVPPSEEVSEPPVEDNETKGKEYSLTGNESEWIQSFSFQIEDENGIMRDWNEVSNIPTYAEISLKISFKTDPTIAITSKDTITYELPDWFYSVKNSDGSVSGLDGNEAGRWSIENGKVVIKYNDTFLGEGKANLSGYFTLNGKINAVNSGDGDDTKITINLGDVQKEFIVKPRLDTGVNNISISKELGQITKRAGERSEIQEVSYSIKVTADSENNKNLIDVTVIDWFTTGEKYQNNVNEYTDNDELKQYITYDDASISCISSTGETRTVHKEDNGNGSCKFILDGELKPGEEISITYNVEIDPLMYQSDPKGNNDGSCTGKSDNNIDMSWEKRNAVNQAKVEAYTDKNADPLVKETTAENELKFDKVWNWKGVTIHEDNKRRVTYTIHMNEDPVMDIRGWKLTDDLTGREQKIISDIKINWNDFNGNTGTDTISLDSLKAESDDIVTKFSYVTNQAAYYEFTFDAEYIGSASSLQEVIKDNLAVLDGPGELEYGAYRTVAFPASTITKRWTDVDIANGTISWQTTIDKGLDVKSGDVFKDWIGRHDETGNSIVYDDHYFTDSQLQKIVVKSGDEQTLVDPSTYSVSRISGDEIPETGKLDGYKIEFNQNIAGPVIISYQTTANFTNISDLCIFDNNSLLDRKGEMYGYYSNYQYKASSMLDKTGISFTEENPTVTWEIKVNDEQTSIGTLIVKDKIPENLEFNKETDIVIKTADKMDIGDVREDLNYQVSYDETTRELKVKFTNIGFTRVIFDIVTKPTVESLMDATKQNKTLTYTNTAELYTNTGKKLMTASAEAKASYQFIDKPLNHDSVASNAHYTIKVNPGGLCLAEGNRLTVTDTMAKGMTFKPDTLEVRNKDTVLNIGTDYTLVPDSDGQGFVLQVPDEMPLTISYDVYISGKVGTKKDIENKVTLSYETINYGESGGSETVDIVDAPSGVEGPNRISIKKMDKNDTTKKLSGAEFEIRTYEDGKPGSLVGKVMTASNGIATTPESWDLITGKVYCLLETDAPEGYLLDETPYPFVFINADTDTSQYTEDVEQINVGYILTLPVYDEKIETIDIPVFKIWNDNNNQRGKRKNVTVKLLADGKDTGRTIVLSESNNWKDSFIDVPKFLANGDAINYTVEEVKIEGYSSVVTGNVTEGFVITNTYVMEGQDTPKVPEVPDVPEAPVELKITETPQIPEKPRIPEPLLATEKSPKTGDDITTLILNSIVAITSLVLVIVLILRKKNKK